MADFYFYFYFFKDSDGDEVKQPSAVMLVRSARTEREPTKPHCCTYSHLGQWQHSVNEWLMQKLGEEKQSQLILAEFVFTVDPTAVFSGYIITLLYFACIVSHLQCDKVYTNVY